MASQRIVVVDYGMGNLHSVEKALEHVAPDADVVVTADAAVIDSADRVVFPGVGAIRDCIAEIRRLGLDDIVRAAIAQKPLLAICVGMQALMDSSEENGGTECLSIVPGKVRWFGQHLHDASGHHLKVPHMGWNQVVHADHPLWQGIDDGTRFYFVHSYFVEPDDASLVTGRCDYGNEFCAALAQGNLFAAQFHPEKSHVAGMQLLKNFSRWKGGH